MQSVFGGWNMLAAAVLWLGAQAIDQAVMLADLQRQDSEVANVGFRLSTANLTLCGDQGFVTGITPHYLNQYASAYRQAAVGRFALDARPSVLAVATGSPAERARLRADDRLLAVDGTPFATVQPSGGDGSYADTERALDQIDRAAQDGGLSLRIERGRTASDVTLALVKGCRSRFQVVPGDTLKAQADGSYVQISAGLAAFARGEDELASVLAHELSHNILRHRVRLEAQGALRKGLFGPGARNARSIRATEIEADRLSPYVMANAGYDPRAAVRYWVRHGADRGDSWFRVGTHPRWRDRVRIIEAEVARIETARGRGEAPAIPADLAGHIAPKTP